MPTNIDISRPQGSTAQLLFNIVDESGNPIDVTNWTNFELSTYIEPAIEFDRTVTFTDSDTSGAFSEAVRVIVGEASAAIEVVPTPIYVYVSVSADNDIKEYGVYASNTWRATVDFAAPASQVAGDAISVAWSVAKGTAVTLGENVLVGNITQTELIAGADSGEALIQCTATFASEVVSEYFLIEVVDPTDSAGVWEIQ